MPQPLLPVIWPRPLLPGGTIGVFSPSGPSSDSSLEHAVSALEARGYRVRLSPHANAKHPDYEYLAGTDEQRAEDLNALWRDESVDLVLCARGGYGAARLLDKLDYDALRRDPKPLVGYSDVTALSLAIAAQTGIVSYSGVMATAGDGFGESTLDAWSEASFFHAVGANGWPRRFDRPETGDGSAPWHVLRGPQTITGPVVPVCLSLLVSLLATPYVPDLSGAILVIEDVSEELYAVDRMLTQLRLAGVLNNLTALLVGSFNGVPTQNDLLRTHVPRMCEQFALPSVAVASGIAYGHIPRRLTLPVGAAATLNLDAGTFTFEGPQKALPLITVGRITS